MSKKGTHPDQSQKPIWKRKPMQLLFIALLSAAALVLLNFNEMTNMSNSTASNEPSQRYEFRKDGTLRFLSDTGTERAAIDIEIAEDDAARTIGLMNRKVVPEYHGMFFIFDEEMVRSFWMHNTYASLDIMFVNSNLEIVMIHPYTQPLSDSSLPSRRPARYVIEVAAGFSDRHGVTVGDRVTWKRR